MSLFKKRGRKPKNLDESQETQECSLSSMSDFKENVYILNLPMKEEEILAEIYKIDNGLEEKIERMTIDEENKNKKIESKCDEKCIKISQDKKVIHQVNFIDKNNFSVNFSEIACWFCCHYFEGEPVNLPINYNSYKEEFQVKGIFCSYNCAYSYLCNDNTIPQIKKNKSLINFYRKRKTNEDFVYIKKAPPKECLIPFGGHITIEEYRKTFITNNSIEVFYIPVIDLGFQIIQKIDVNTNYNITKNVKDVRTHSIKTKVESIKRRIEGSNKKEKNKERNPERKDITYFLGIN